MLEYFRYIIFEKVDNVIIERPEKFGGNIELKNYQELEEKFKGKQIHPMDVKETAAKYIEQMIKPIREKILNDSKLSKLREEIGTFEVTR